MQKIFIAQFPPMIFRHIQFNKIFCPGNKFGVKVFECNLGKNLLFAVIILFPVNYPGNLNRMFNLVIPVLISDKYFPVGFMHLRAYRHFEDNYFFTVYFKFAYLQKIYGMKLFGIVGQIGNVFF